MLELNWKTVVELARSGNEGYFNKYVTEMYDDHFYQHINKFTGDPTLTREVYTSAMAKFWERFILNREPLPKSNIKGYIYKMSKNAFIDIKRQIKRKKECELYSKQALHVARDYSQYFKSDDMQQFGSYRAAQNEHDRKLFVLHDSISKLESKCREIIRRNVYEGEQLKDMKEELGFTGTYQSIVEKKKRCIRKLSKLILASLQSYGPDIKIKQLQ